MRLSRPPLLSLSLLALLSLSAGCGPRYHLSLYETAPTETTLDHPDIADAYQVWLDQVSSARRSIDLSEFYAVDAPGSRLQPVVQALETAAARGVRIRFLADAKMGRTYPELLDHLAAVPGIQVRRYDVNALTGGVQHSKYIVVDGERVCLGSQNFDWRSLEHVQELGLLIDHPSVVTAVQQVFDADWALAGGESGTAVARAQAPSFPVPVRFGHDKVEVTPVFSPQGLLPDPETWDLPRLVALIDGANQSVRVQLMSFEVHGYGGTVFSDLDTAMRRAAARGVQVQLLVADWSQRHYQIGDLKEIEQVHNITVKLVTIPEHSSGFIPYGRVIHAKYAVIDGEESWIGSSNWGGDYFFKSRNVGLLMEGAPMGERLDAFFTDLWDSPYAAEVDPARTYPEPRIKE